MRVDEKRTGHDELASIFINRKGRFLPVSKSKSQSWKMINVKTLQPGDFNCDGVTDFVGVTKKKPKSERKTVIKYFIAKAKIMNTK